MLNFNSLGSLKGSSSARVILRQTCSTMSYIATKYGKVCQEQKMVYSAKCRECGHFIGRSNFDFMKKEERLNAILRMERIGVNFLIPTISVLLGLGLFFVRRYNQSFSYGTGGCRSIMLWPYNECVVQA
ncbi:uncharacterized protein LOC117787910 [Drosophila innubila]|uniref:uncharacterized protein LOC117787910 n=1 Tax=Drosophila innubila TaxID=198719 RepID=UPI00148CE118|nr:uncharacterized protein LOC117787910 [Drosophila innubila]